MKVNQALTEIQKMNKDILSRQLEKEYGITLSKLDQSTLSREVMNKTYSPYSFASSYLVIAQNPTHQMHEKLLKIEVPYKEFEIFKLGVDHN